MGSVVTQEKDENAVKEHNAQKPSLNWLHPPISRQLGWQALLASQREKILRKS
jgi:hypothetical protein